ncbi:MAG: hypothetical protein IJ828_07625 [Treponema sp.]|mgnify:CR=1 FL=1|nr:hypothetical protein [Treponema sp.]
MEIIDNIKANAEDFVKKNSKLTVAILCILIFLSLTAIFILIGTAGSRSSSEKKMKNLNLPEEVFSKKEDFLPPADIKMTEDYYFSRITEDTWSDEELNRWFSMPNDSNMKSLEDANDALINKITEAAP